MFTTLNFNVARRKYSHTAHRPTRQHWVQAKSSDEQPLPIVVISKKGSHTTDKESNEKNIHFFLARRGARRRALRRARYVQCSQFWNARAEPWRAQQSPIRTDIFTFPTSRLARFFTTLNFNVARRKYSHTAHRPTRQHWVQEKSSDEQPLPIVVLSKKGSHTTDKESNEKNIHFFLARRGARRRALRRARYVQCSQFWNARAEPWRAQQSPIRTDIFTFPTSHLARFCTKLYSQR